MCIYHLCPSICLYLPPCVSFIYVCVSGSSRHLSIYQEREIIFKELAHAAVGAGRSKIFRVDQQAQERADVAAKAQRPSAGGIPSSLGGVSLYSLKAVN